MSTTIEWTDETWNPTRGCSRISEGCRHCYAEAIAARFSNPGNTFHGFAERTPEGPRWTGDVVLLRDRLAEPLTWKRPRRVFVDSMSDLFHENLPDAAIDQVFAVMALCPQHTFQILTKRAERMRAYMIAPGLRQRVLDAMKALKRSEGLSAWGLESVWPLPNVWLGVSVENQHFADERISLLLQTPAAVRFISAEPLLGPVDLSRIQMPGHPAYLNVLSRGLTYESRDANLDWVIVGGESGPGARPMHPDWARAIRNQCQAAGVPFFFKQWGEFRNGSGTSPADADRIILTDGRAFSWDGYAAAFSQTPNGLNPTIMAKVGKKAAGRFLDGRVWNEYPGSTRNSPPPGGLAETHGGD